MKKILIMVMGCDIPFFNKQCDVIKETWAKPILDGKYPNIEFVIYKGTYNRYPTHTYKRSTHELLLRVEDDLNNTYKKTHYAFSLASKKFEYDYIFRTNTSTYINVELLNSFVQSKEDNDIIWTSEIYSLTDALTPYPLYCYGRGNGLLFYKTTIDIILKEGISMLYLEKCDDWIIGNILNSYWIKQGKNYLDYIKSFKHGWYKSSNNASGNGNTICQWSNTDISFDFIKQFMTIQVKKYYELRDENHYTENDSYYELYNTFLNNSYDDIELAVKDQHKYAECPNVFIGSAIGYMPYSDWLRVDKNKLYVYEVMNKATDDAQSREAKKYLF